MYGSKRRITDFIPLGQFREEDKNSLQVPFVALEDILAATDNFSEANKLGKGGFGPVYKVIILIESTHSTPFFSNLLFKSRWCFRSNSASG